MVTLTLVIIALVAVLAIVGGLCLIGNGGLLGFIQGGFLVESGFKVLGAVFAAIADANK